VTSASQYTFIFDLGDTLIDDPFDVVLSDSRLVEGLRQQVPCLADQAICDTFIAHWRTANREIDFQFASHFAQEEPWIQSALQATALCSKDAETSGPAVLSIYRALLGDAISRQTHLPLLRDTLHWLRAAGGNVWVASNDRSFATPSFLRWAGLDRYVEKTFVSEGLSRKFPKAEKPNIEFFSAIVSLGGLSGGDMRRVVHIGDSELRDIIPARTCGMTTVRYLAPRSRSSSSWRDSADDTIADYSYSDRSDLKKTLERVISDGV
jgi:FMN phosphatase YigB (HAD superfamily)